jgi:diadenosine tetraphosphate (Ap4A) HIT family hydrolase
MNKFINLSNSRLEEQKKVMEEINLQGHCPFCAENLPKYHKRPVIKEGKYWILTENQWPYDKINHQLLAIYKTHIEHLSEMEPEAGAELIEMFKEEALKRKMPGGGIAIRFGTNPSKGNYGSTVSHIHAHLFEPDLDSLESDAKSDGKWKFTFGKSKKSSDL